MASTPPKASKAQIDQFLKETNIALAGISQTSQKFGNSIFNFLKVAGYNLFPLHRQLKTFDEVACYEDIGNLPDFVNALIICTKAESSMELIQQAVEKGIKNIWLQQGAQHDEAIYFAQQNGVNIIHRECIFMFAEPVKSIHSFHRGINKFFGIYPN